MAEPQYDAFGNILSLDSDLDKPTTYNIYENRAFSSGLGASLQDVYGTKSMPMFQFIRQIKTGERTYDPSRPEDRDFREQYERYQQQNPQVPTFGQLIGEAVIGGAVPVAGAVIEGLVNPGGFYEGSALSRAGQGALDTFSKSPQQTITNRLYQFDPSEYVLGKNQVFLPGLADAEAARATGNIDLYRELNPKTTLNPSGKPMQLEAETKDFLGFERPKQGIYDATKLADAGYNVASDGTISTFENPVLEDMTPIGNVGAPITATSSGAGGFTGYVSDVGDQLSFSSPAGQSNLATAGGAGLMSAAATLVMTGDVEKAAKTGVGTTVGKAIGTALTLGNPIGGIVGGIIGGALGGRVICNELCKQGLITRKQLINDYKFTRDYLSTKHINGYHLWALWMVKQMRKGKYVDFWKHIVIHRSNEIAYIYGERDKPDYLGKLYRKIFEPVCWTLGLFCKETDWSVLYKTKEI